MAKKRLNKKVVLIGSVVFMLLGLAAIGVVLHLIRDPEKVIKDGDAAMRAAAKAVDEEIKQEQYEIAARCYLRARAWAKSDSLRVEVLYKLVDLFLEIGKWTNARGCWNEIIRIDPKSVKARYGRLKYFYIMADSGAGGAWKEVASQASEFIELAEDMDLLVEDKTQWESFKVPEDKVRTERIGPYLYLLRGRASLEIVRMGMVTDPDELLARAIDDLEKVLELEPDNTDAHWYLAQAAIVKGDILASRGDLEEKDKAAEHAKELLKQAVELASSDVSAHINLLRMKSTFAQMTGKEQVRPLEPEYLSLVEKFPSRAEAFLALAEFYMKLGLEGLDRAVEAIEKAIELDRENVVYAINATNLYHRKFHIYGQKSALYKGIKIAQNALTLPGVQETKDPRQAVNRRNRILLYFLLANYYIEQVLEPFEVRTEPETQEWLTNAEKIVHEIEQFFGSGEEPQVVKWQGMLELAKARLGKGDRNVAIRKLYATYEQLKASERERGERQDPQLSYALAKLFENTNEIGAVAEFLTSALTIPRVGIALTKPEALLDYAEVLLELMAWHRTIINVNTFEKNFEPNDRSRVLRIRAYIGAGQFDQAEEKLAELEPDDPNTIKLNIELVQARIRRTREAMVRKRSAEGSGIISQWWASKEQQDGRQQALGELMTAELKGYRNALAELVDKLLSVEPNSVDGASVVAVCGNYVTEGDIQQAEDLLNRFLKYFPDDVTILFYKKLLSEPEPDKVSQQRRNQIEEKVLLSITDPVHQAVSLGIFYRRNNEPNKAVEQFKKVLGPYLEGSDNLTSERGAVLQVPKVVDKAVAGSQESQTQDVEFGDYQRLAAGHLMDIAVATKDWKLAEQIVDVARLENIDECEGNFFAARLAFAKQEYKDALARINECLRQRPVFSHGLMLRSNVNTALGNEHASIEDIRKAASLNPLDGAIVKVLANELYQRDKRMGDNALPEQIAETRKALDIAVVLNQGDLQLRSFYAEYVSSTEPLRALAIRQYLQRVVPSVRNAVLFGRLAMRTALQETNRQRRDALLAVAASAFEQAKAIDPQNRAMLNSYAEYYRSTGQEKKAEELLVQSQDKRLLWGHYLRSGRLGDAKGILEQLYQTDANDSRVVRGLLLVAERTGDREAVKKYSEELVSLEDTIENYLIQMQTFLDTGLVKEVEYKLQSFRERYPDEPRALMLDAWLTMRQGRLTRALELANRSLEADQAYALVWRLRGEINRLMANYDQAIIDLKKSKSLSDEPVTRISLAKAYLRAGRIEDTITELENTADNPRAPVEAGLLLEQIYLRLGRKEALARFYEGALEKFPDNLLWYNRAGEFALATGDPGTAEQLYGLAWQKGLREKNADPEALDGYLRALLSAGKLNKLFEEAAKYVDGYFAPVAYLRMADAKMKLGDRADAIQYCRRAVDKAGTNEVFAFNILQRMHVLLGAKEVLKYCKQKLETNPDSLAANYAMFNLAKIGGEYNKAAGYIDKCLEIVGPDNPVAVDYIVKKVGVLQLAYTRTSDNDYLNKAIAEYESLVAKMPNNTSVLNNLAYMLAEAGMRLPDAIEYIKRAYELRPNNPGLLDTYAYVLYRNGKFQEAVEFSHSALQQYEQNKVSAPADVYEHLGMIKEKLGAKDEALAAYQQAMETGEDTLSDAAKQRIKAAIERASQQVIEK